MAVAETSQQTNREEEAKVGGACNLQEREGEYDGLANPSFQRGVKPPDHCLWQNENDQIQGDIKKDGSFVNVGPVRAGTLQPRVPRLVKRLAACLKVYESSAEESNQRTQGDIADPVDGVARVSWPKDAKPLEHDG